MKLFVLVCIPMLAFAGWFSQTSGTIEHLNDVHFPADDLTGYVVGYSGTILKTTDGGDNWTELVSGSSQTLFSVTFVDANTGLVGANNGWVLKTTDAGASWTGYHTGARGAVWALDFPTASTGYAWTEEVGYASFCKSTDGGETWSVHASDHIMFGFDFPENAQTGYACGTGGVVFKTTDGGATWTNQSYQTSNQLTGVDFPVGEYVGFTVGMNGMILKTIDGGGIAESEPPEVNRWHPTATIVRNVLRMPESVIRTSYF